MCPSLSCKLSVSRLFFGRIAIAFRKFRNKKLYEIIRNYTKLPSDSIATSRKIL